MQPTERAEFRDIVIAACRHVLPQCGLLIQPEANNVKAANERTEQLAGFIGFSGDVLRGAVTMLVPVVLVRGSYPLPLEVKSSIEGQLELFDWCGEIVNRLLGRIKAGLALRGLDIEPSTPKTMMAEQIQFVISEPRCICAVRFSCGQGSVAVLVDAMAAEGKSLFRSPSDATAAQPEGELVLF